MEMPAVDLYQTDNEVVVKASLPGMNPDDINISVTADVLTLKGDYKQEDEIKDAQYHIREHRHGIFERSIMLPASVQPDKAKAEFDKGILANLKRLQNPNLLTGFSGSFLHLVYPLSIFPIEQLGDGVESIQILGCFLGPFLFPFLADRFGGV